MRVTDAERLDLACLRAENERLKHHLALLSAQVPPYYTVRRQAAALRAAIEHIQGEQEFWRHCVETGVMSDPQGELDEIDRLLEDLRQALRSHGCNGNEEGCALKRALGDSPTKEYRYCLDALLATISDIEHTNRLLKGFGRQSGMLANDILTAKERASELAGRLHEKWADS